MTLDLGDALVGSLFPEHLAANLVQAENFPAELAVFVHGLDVAIQADFQVLVGLVVDSSGNNNPILPNDRAGMGHTWDGGFPFDVACRLNGPSGSSLKSLRRATCVRSSEGWPVD